MRLSARADGIFSVNFLRFFFVTAVIDAVSFISMPFISTTSVGIQNIFDPCSTVPIRTTDTKDIGTL